MVVSNEPVIAPSAIERSASRLAPRGFGRQREGNLVDVAAPQIADRDFRRSARESWVSNRARSPSETARTRLVGLTFCVDENVLAEASLNLFAGERIGDRAAERRRRLSALVAFQRAIGKEGDDERSGAHLIGAS